jgi:hypothetical protein
MADDAIARLRAAIGTIWEPGNGYEVKRAAEDSVLAEFKGLTAELAEKTAAMDDIRSERDDSRREVRHACIALADEFMRHNRAGAHLMGLPALVQHVVDHHHWHHDAENADYVRGLEEQKTALEDRIRTILDEAVSMMPVMPAQEALTLLEEHVHSLRMAVEIAQEREPTQAEGDAHEWRQPSHAKGECFVPAGGWTGRRCRACNRWVWGGPTACVGCAEQPAETEEQAAERELGAWLVAHPGWTHEWYWMPGHDALGPPFTLALIDRTGQSPRRKPMVRSEGPTKHAAIREALRLAKETP